MQTTLLGVVKVDPKELLTEGIRRELVSQLTNALQSGLTFRQGKTAELDAALARLSVQLDGFQLALEYISDYVKINGLRLWQEELAAVVNFYVEQERNAFLKRKVHSWQSTFTRAAAAANLAPPAAFEHSFFGRLVRELLYLTSPRRAIYSEALGGWVDTAGKEVVGRRVLMRVQHALSLCGLRGVSSTLGFMVSAQLHRFVVVYQQIAHGEVLGVLDRLNDTLQPTSTLPDKPQKMYATAAQAAAKLLAEVHETVWRCGAAQLLRAHSNSILQGATEIDCHLLHSTLANADAALLAELQAEEAAGKPLATGAIKSPVDADGAMGPTSQVAGGLSPYLDAAGQSQPKEQVLVVAPPLPLLPLVLALFTITQLGKMAWNNSLAALSSANGKLSDESIDGTPLVCGIATVLRQFHASVTTQFVAFVGQYVRAMLHSTIGAQTKGGEPPSEVVTLLQFLDLFSKHAGVEAPGLELYQTAVGSMT